MQCRAHFIRITSRSASENNPFEDVELAYLLQISLGVGSSHVRGNKGGGLYERLRLTQSLVCASQVHSPHSSLDAVRWDLL
jgi:hypothetical protein